MHVLIGFAVLVGLVAFAFGGDVARKFVIGVAILLLAGATYFVIDVARELRAPDESAKMEHVR